MGASQHEASQCALNGLLKVPFQGSRVTSHADLILARELDERLGLETVISEHLNDSRQESSTECRLVDLLPIMGIRGATRGEERVLTRNRIAP